MEAVGPGTFGGAATTVPPSTSATTTEPGSGLLTEEQVEALVAYVRGLHGEETPGEGSPPARCGDLEASPGTVPPSSDAAIPPSTETTIPPSPDVAVPPSSETTAPPAPATTGPPAMSEPTTTSTVPAAGRTGE